MGNIWGSILDFFESALELLHGGLEPLFGVHAWGWAIIALTLIVRVALLPLAIKQTRSMREMQKLQPELKALQKKYKVDRDLLKKDPQKYQAMKQKLQQEQMALYKDAGVNPAASCLPLIAQMPIFFALFSVLRDSPVLKDAPFYFVTGSIPSGTDGGTGLGASVSAAGVPGYVLIALMAGTMFWSQRQMMSRNQADGAQAQQQKIMMFVMPVFLAFISLGFPLGVLLYWVTTNIWQMGQQAFILHEVKADMDDEDPKKAASGGASSGDKRSSAGRSGSTSSKSKPSKSKPSKSKPDDDTSSKSTTSNNGSPSGRDRDTKRSGRKEHLPRRRR